MLASLFYFFSTKIHGCHPFCLVYSVHQFIHSITKTLEKGKSNYYNSEYNQAFLDTAEGEVSYNANGIISVNYTYNWFMGGVFNRNYDGFTYDLNTGERVSLADLLSGSEAEVLTSVQNVYWDAIVEHYGATDTQENARDYFEAKTLNDYKFFVGENGEIYLIADTYEFAPGAAGAYVFASGLFVTKAG